MPELDPMITDFLKAVGDFDTAAWAIVDRRKQELRLDGWSELGKSLKVSAALESQIERAVTLALRDRNQAMKAVKKYALSPLLSATTWACMAIATRHKLSDEDFQLLLRPWVDAGLPPDVLTPQ